MNLAMSASTEISSPNSHICAIGGGAVSRAITACCHVMCRHIEEISDRGENEITATVSLIESQNSNRAIPCLRLVAPRVSKDKCLLWCPWTRAQPSLFSETKGSGHPRHALTYLVHSRSLTTP